jgi:hypothetical protein
MMTWSERRGSREEERRRTTMTMTIGFRGTDYQKQAYPLESLQEVT